MRTDVPVQATPQLNGRSTKALEQLGTHFNLIFVTSQILCCSYWKTAPAAWILTQHCATTDASTAALCASARRASQMFQIGGAPDKVLT